MVARSHTWALGFLFATVFAVSGCSHLATVRNPAALAAAPTLEATEQAILDAVPRHAWSTEEVTPGRIVAFLSTRSILLRCEIRYDEREVRISYLDSDKLGAEPAKNGEVRAHGKVNKWMARLAADIQASLTKAQVPR